MSKRQYLKSFDQTAQFTGQRHYIQPLVGDNFSHEQPSNQGMCFFLQKSEDNERNQSIYGNIDSPKDSNQSDIILNDNINTIQDTQDTYKRRFQGINKNCQKYLVCSFVKFWELYGLQLYKNNEQGYEQLKKMLRQYRSHYRMTKNYKLEHLANLFRTFMSGDPRNNLLNRQIMHKIISQKISNNIKSSRQMRDKLCYLKICKLFLIRLRSPKLISRVQIPH